MRRQGKTNRIPRRLTHFVLASAVFFLVLLIRLTYAEESYTSTKTDEKPAAEQPGQIAASDAPEKPTGNGASAAPGQTFDPAVVNAGQAAFERSCATCHDAARSLERTKDLSGWRATVRRMAAKPDADVASGDIEAIATFLASRSASGPGAQAGKTGASADETSVSTFATLSPMWRGGDEHLQNPDFGALAFFGASWQSKIVSARVTLCITCHGVKEGGQISRVEPVEAAVHFDLSQFFESRVHGMKAGVDAGRFVVPFGAFSAQVNPGLYNTVSPPLIFDMGERIYNTDLGFPVLPMPDADEGVDLNLNIPVGCCGAGPITATMDAYVVNGLQGNSLGVDFLQTRNLYDNNGFASGGGRVTVGVPEIRAGASVMSGRFDDPTTSGVPGALDYTVYGFDVQAHYERLLRCQFEYARRDSDRFGFTGSAVETFTEAVFGYYAEVEVRRCNESHVSFLARYDSQSRHSPLPPPGSTLPTGSFDVERLTLGVNFELWRQSLLMIDLERWLVPEPDKRVANVGGVRYTITF
jgi:hypothetical protein